MGETHGVVSFSGPFYIVSCFSTSVFALLTFPKYNIVCGVAVVLLYCARKSLTTSGEFKPML